MNWNDTPIERLKSHRLSHKQRALMELREKNRRAKLWDSGTTAWNMKPAAVLVPWHTDEQGCRARTVGNES